MTENITISELRRHHCVAGIRRWFTANGLDFRAFMREGIAAEDMLATGDAMGVDAVAKVRGDRARGEG